jgi:hypothetical protein
VRGPTGGLEAWSCRHCGVSQAQNNSTEVAARTGRSASRESPPGEEGRRRRPSTPSADPGAARISSSGSWSLGGHGCFDGAGGGAEPGLGEPMRCSFRWRLSVWRHDETAAGLERRGMRHEPAAHARRPPCSAQHHGRRCLRPAGHDAKERSRPRRRRGVRARRHFFAAQSSLPG